MPTDFTEYTITIKGIRFRSKHGVSDAERTLPQDFVVHVKLTLPVAVLPASDRLAEVFDYDTISSIVVDEGTTRSYRLLEVFASKLLERLLRDTPATRARVSVQKSRPPTTHSVDTATITLMGQREPAPGARALRTKTTRAAPARKARG